MAPQWQVERMGVVFLAAIPLFFFPLLVLFVTTRYGVLS
jgi:hypothetical protein